MSVLSPAASCFRLFVRREINKFTGRAQFRGNIDCNNIADIGHNSRARPRRRFYPQLRIKSFRALRHVDRRGNERTF
jgi:hypothetical protein